MEYNLRYEIMTAQDARNNNIYAAGIYLKMTTNSAIVVSPSSLAYASRNTLSLTSVALGSYSIFEKRACRCVPAVCSSRTMPRRKHLMKI